MDTTKRFFKLLRDKRIESLRELVRSAAAGTTEFDDEFAKRTLNEVFQAETRIAATTRMVSWLSLPLGFVPVVGTPLQKLVEEVGGHFAGKRNREQHKWFFVMSDFERRKPAVKQIVR